jgi:hypothetical protein
VRNNPGVALCGFLAVWERLAVSRRGAYSFSLSCRLWDVTCSFTGSWGVGALAMSDHAIPMETTGSLRVLSGVIASLIES